MTDKNSSRMALFTSRAEQLAQQLRARILKNEWREPLPNTRDWARQLAVGRNNLGAALAILQKEGLLEITRRKGVRLVFKKKKPIQLDRPRVVRVIYYGIDYNTYDPNFIPWFGPLHAILQKRGVQLSLEKHSGERLRQICGGKFNPLKSSCELMLALSLPVSFLRLLSASGRPSICIGIPAHELDLPFLMANLSDTIRHATHSLIRRGFTRLTLILPKTHAVGSLKLQDSFHAACRDWSKEPIHGNTLMLRLKEEEERNTLLRFAGRIHQRHGIVTMPPIPVGLIVTTLLSAGISIPQQVDITVVSSYPDSVLLHPPLVHYPFPMETFIKTMANAIFRFFETGERPRLRKILPLEMITPT